MGGVGGGWDQVTEPNSLEVFLRDPRAFWPVDRGRREGVLREGPPRTCQA